MTTRITIRKPDDWHLHVRDGAMLKAVLPYTAKNFGRAILMPNLVPPVRTTADAVAYRERVMAALPAGADFQPLMTCYVTDDTDPDDVERGFKEGVFTGVKLYPAHATTNSAYGVTDFVRLRRVLERMQKIDMPFLMHGEVTDPDVDIFDREAVFIERRLNPWVKDFPGLRMILEHLSSKDGVDFVASAAPQVGGTITPYHMILTRTDMLGHGIQPYMYCMPVVKTEKDRLALRKAVTSGAACYFLQLAGRDRDLCQGVRGGRRARQARSLRLAQRAAALSSAAQRGHDHARKIAMDGAGRGQGRGPRRQGTGLPRWRNDRVARGGELI
jgi:dihydroorotase